MLVGKAIDGSMEHDSFHEACRVLCEEALLRASDEIPQESSDTGRFVGVGKVKVSEKVQSLRA